MNIVELAISIRKIYGKLSFVDHSLFHTLKKMHNLNQMTDYVHAVGASLNEVEMHIIEKIASVILDLDEYYTLPDETSSTTVSIPSSEEVS